MATHAMSLSSSDAASEASRLAWLGLVLTPGLGPTRIFRAVQVVGDAARLLELSLTELEGVKLPAESVQFIADGRALAAAEKEAKAVYDAGATFLTLDDEEYP